MKKGSKHSPETIRRIRESVSGDKNPMYGVRFFGKNNPFYGKTHSSKTRQIISDGMRNEKNYGWKGEMVGNKALHVWIRKNKPRPDLCDDCHIKPPKDVATIDGKYIRNIDYFRWLCASCHLKLDYKLGIRKHNKRWWELQKEKRVGDAGLML